MGRRSREDDAILNAAGDLWLLLRGALLFKLPQQTSPALLQHVP